MSWATLTVPSDALSAVAVAAAGYNHKLNVKGLDTPNAKRLWIYDPAGPTWTRGTDCPTSTTAPAWVQLVTLGSHIYCVTSDATDFWRYDPTGDAWTDLTSSVGFTAAAGQVDMTTDGTRLLALVDVDGDTFPLVKAYNVGAGTWSTYAPKLTSGVAPNGLSAGGFDVFGAVLVAIGGWNGVTADPDGVVVTYDTTTSGPWTAQTSSPRPREGFITQVHGLSVFPTIGGDDATTSYSTHVDIYDPTTDTWTTGADLPTGLDFAGGALLDGTVYALGVDGGSSSVMYSALSSDLAPIPTQNIDLHIPFQWTIDVIGPVAASTVTTDDEDAWQIPFGWSFLVDVIPVEDPPPATDPYIQQASEVMPFPTLVNGRPVGWEPTSVTRADWGRLQLIVNGRDVSRPRGMAFQPLSVAYTEPFGDAEASFAFPGITEFDDPADFHLTPLASVTLRRKDPTGVFHTLYEGELASLEPDQADGNGLVIQCVGALYRTDLLKEPPRLLVQAQDYGDLIVNAFNDKRARYNLNVGHMAAVKTGILGVRNADFQPFLTGTIQDYLAELTTNTGAQWTVVKAYPRTPKLMLKDTTTVHVNVAYGQRGIDVRLSKDFTTATTAVYASGTDGHCQWMGARFPNLTQETAPTFPLAVGHTFVGGDGQSGFAVFAAFLRRGQYGTIVSDDTYDSRDIDNVEQFQDRAGITIDGIVGAQTWEAAFQPGANQGSLAGAYVDTIYEKPQTRRRAYNAQGADIGPNPTYDPTVPRIEDYIPFGDNVSKNLGRNAAQQIINRNYPAGRTGTITFTADPENMSRWDLRAGMNINVANYAGGTVTVHTTRAVQDWKAGTVTCTVDEKARDQLTAAAIHQRNKDLSDLTRRQKFGRVKSKVFDDYGTWLCEDGAGEIPLMNQQGGFWNIQRIAAAPKGTIARISLAMGSGLTEHVLNQSITHTIGSVPGAARGAIGIFANPVTPRALTNLPGMARPITSLGDGSSPWDHNQDALNTLGLVYAAGGPGAAIGFYPNSDPGDGSGTFLTGMFEDGASVDFGPTGHYWLWVAIWTLTSCKVGGRLFPGAPA